LLEIELKKTGTNDLEDPKIAALLEKHNNGYKHGIEQLRLELAGRKRAISKGGKGVETACCAIY
jgi:hypothetical protein